jgi:hypothetical protein
VIAMMLRKKSSRSARAGDYDKALRRADERAGRKAAEAGELNLYRAPTQTTTPYINELAAEYARDVLAELRSAVDRRTKLLARRNDLHVELDALAARAAERRLTDPAALETGRAAQDRRRLTEAQMVGDQASRQQLQREITMLESEIERVPTDVKLAIGELHGLYVKRINVFLGVLVKRQSLGGLDQLLPASLASDALTAALATCLHGQPSGLIGLLDAPARAVRPRALPSLDNEEPHDERTA